MILDTTIANRWNQWEIVDGIKEICSDDFEPIRISEQNLDPMDVENIMASVKDNEVDPQGHFLRSKVTRRMLYTTVAI